MNVAEHKRRLVAIETAARAALVRAREAVPEMPRLEVLDDWFLAGFASGVDWLVQLAVPDFHDDKIEVRPDRHISTGPGDCDTAGRPLIRR